MATVYSRGSRLWIQYYLDGKRKREPLELDDTRENRALARKLKKQKEVEIDSGVYREKKRRIKNRGILLSEGFEEFLLTKEDKAKDTIRAYQTAYKSFSEFLGDRVIGKIGVSDFEKYEEYLKLKVVNASKKREEKKRSQEVKALRRTSPNTIANYFNHLKIIFSYFEKMEYVKGNPVPGKIAKGKEIKIIPEEQLIKILAALRKKDKIHYNTIMLFLLTGLRAGELARLSFEDIDFKDNLLKVKNSKGRREDILPLYQELKEFILENWEIKEGKLVPYSRSDSFKFWTNFLKKNGFPHYTIHTLRKTFLSNLVNSGLSVYDVKTMARHKDISTTMKFYLAADMNKLGQKVNSAVRMNSKLLSKESKHLKLVK